MLLERLRNIYLIKKRKKAYFRINRKTRESYLYTTIGESIRAHSTAYPS